MVKVGSRKLLAPTPWPNVLHTGSSAKLVHPIPTRCGAPSFMICHAVPTKKGLVPFSHRAVTGSLGCHLKNTIPCSVAQYFLSLTLSPLLTWCPLYHLLADQIIEPHNLVRPFQPLDPNPNRFSLLCPHAPMGLTEDSKQLLIAFANTAVIPVMLFLGVLGKPMW